ncbi:MAG: O-antigen ligase family protein [Pyrinomonadaceae bacterium]
MGLQNFIERIDLIAGIRPESGLAPWLERIAFIFLFLMVLSAPHSIAATQIAWLTGMLAWVIRLFVAPRPALVRTPLDIPLWAFFGWAVVAALCSYEPLVSLDKLRGAALFLIFYFVINNLRHLRAVKFLALALIFSTMINVLWTPVERAFGRGVEIHGLSAESPLKKALLWEGDTLLKADGRKIRTPEELVEELKRNETTRVEFYRPDFNFTVEVKRADLLDGGGDPLKTLGIESWKKSRNWRSQGFYGHYATYAEVLQLITSLVLGLFIAGLFKEKGKRQKAKEDDEKEGKIQNPKSKIQNPNWLFLFCLLMMAFALLLTVTRASQLGFLISAFTIVLLGGSRKMILILAAVALPVAVGGLIFLHQTREVGFFDRSDDSITYRETVYREGINLWLKNPRHFFLGVGMDTVTKKEYVQRWHLFDDGRLAMSHFHSTPIQLLVERGLFGLLLWLLLFGAYLRTLWKGIKTGKKENPKSEIRNPKFFSGLLLGCAGGAVGFFASGMVHYNLGDAEVAMVFYLLMGLGVFVCQAIRRGDFGF